MKKVLTLFLAFCMLLSVIPMAISAETINPTPDSSAKTTPAYAGVQNTAKSVEKTVYMKSTGNDSNDGLTEETPVLTLAKAFTLLPDGGELVVLDDIVQSNSNSNTWHIALSENTKPIYIHGVAKDDGSYTSLKFNPKSNGGAALLELEGPVVFYDITVGSTKSSVNFWIVTNAYSCTIGRNVKTETVPNSAKTTGFAKIICGRFNNDNDNTNNAASSLAVTNIYSGEWNEVFVTSRDKTATQNGGVLNVLSNATITTLYAAYDGATNVTGDIVVNYYSGTIATINGYDVSGRTNTLNIYGKTKDQVTDITNYSGVFDDGGVGVINENVTGTAPAFQPLSYSVRFVAVLADSYTNYSEIGFTLKANGKDYSSECKKVYTSIAGNGTDPYTAEELGGQYIFALALKDIPTSAGTVTFEVTPYVVDSTGTHNGATYTVVYNAGAFVSSSAN